jgi:hypothetical protein
MMKMKTFVHAMTKLIEWNEKWKEKRKDDVSWLGQMPKKIIMEARKCLTMREEKIDKRIKPQK